MNMYNFLFGQNPLSRMALRVLNLYSIKVLEFGNLQDIFFELENDQHRIRVHARNVGGNSPEFEELNQTLSEHPWYLNKEVCKHDQTCCDYLFLIPAEVVENINQSCEKTRFLTQDLLWRPPPKHVNRFENAISQMGKGLNTE